MTLLTEKIALLHRLISGHLISFAKGINWRIPARFEVEITDWYRQQPRVLHDVLRPAFDLEFRTQLFLPSGIGIGKGVSHGFGVIRRQTVSKRSKREQSALALQSALS